MATITLPDGRTVETDDISDDIYKRALGIGLERMIKDKELSVSEVVTKHLKLSSRASGPNER